MSNHRVSIGLTVYNGEEFLEETLMSFRNQTFSDYELIISDNASMDRTAEISRSFGIEDDRIRYHCNETNLGLAGNHNRVLALAQGEYFKWAAADDLCRPTYLARCVEVLDNDPTVVLAYPKTLFIDATGKSLDIHDPGWDLRSNEPQERLRRVISSCHWMNAIVGLTRTSSLKRTRLMPAYSGGDYRVLGELSLLGKIYEIPEVLFERRIHPGSTSQHEACGMNPDSRWLIRWWTGTDAKVSMPRWSLSLDHFRTIVRSELPLKHKLSLARTLFRHVRWQRANLWEEGLEAILHYCHIHRLSVN